MPGEGPFIAIDWGTTNRRAWRIAADGAVEDAFADGAGISTVPAHGFAAEAARLREMLGDLPMLLGGMIGSNRGWCNVPYVPCPAGAADLARAICWMDDRTGIIPGVSQDRRDAPDVMRGEEVQIIGALADGALLGDALACLPGTHAKWARIKDGQIVAFSTWMTGELFALLARHSILAPQMEGAVQPGPAFVGAVAASGRGDPLGALFRLRAARLLDAPMLDGPAYVSGLLIGAEVRAGLQLHAGEVPCLIGRTDLCALYAVTIAEVQGQPASLPRVIDGSSAFVVGTRALMMELR